MSLRIIPWVPVTAAMLTSNVSEAGDPAAYNPATSYAAGAQVTDTTAHLIYESRVAANVGNTPATSPTQWLKIGSTNRYACLDQRVSSRTTNADSIVMGIAYGDMVTDVCFLNLDADSIDITVTDPVDGLVFAQTYSLVEGGEIDDYYAYFFNPIELSNRLYVGGLPPYPSATVTITINKPGGTAACGMCGVGFGRDSGDAEFGLSLGLDDYSQKNTNTFGDTALVEGAYADNMSLTAWVKRGKSAALIRRLTSLRAKPAFYVGEGTMSDTLLYGWPETWRCVLTYPNEDIYTISFKGLT